MKKNFLAGLLTGISGALIIVCVIGAVLVYGKDKEKINLENAAGTVESAQAAEQTPYDQIVDKLSFLEKLVDAYYLEDVDESSFAEGIYKGFINSLDDPYSTYYTAKEYNDLMESSSGTYCGIGATVSQNADSGLISIVKPFKGSPADKAGILPGDIIYKVNGEEVSGKDLSEVVSKMKGLEGTKVTITIVREGKTEPLELKIARKQIEVPTIEYQMLSGKIGYIVISEFDKITVSQFSAAVDKLETQGMKGLIVDVRNNPGGLLDSVVSILDRLLPPELIVYTQDKNGVKEEEFAKDKKKITVPMAVLINGNSASASEIFAGTIQDYKVGTLVGTTSFGKGIVQKVIPLSDGTAVKLTVSKYYTPKGRNIHKTGIKPDVKVELDEEMQKQIVVPIEKDNQLQKAISIIKSKMK